MNEQPPLHPAFQRYHFSEPRVDGIFRVDCLGAKARSHYMPNTWFDFVEVPKRNEMLFEWIDLLDAISSAPGEDVTVIDLGAGYGRWLVIAAIAARQLVKKAHVVGVEAEPTHYSWMLEHFADNGILPSDYTAIQSVVSDIERDVSFATGHPTEWYGQYIVDNVEFDYGDWPDAKISRLKAIPALDLIERFPAIHALHMDLQHEELRVVPAIMELATRTVRRMHVETHSAQIDRELPLVFKSFGWRPRFQFPSDTKGVPTEYGDIDFQGGVQSWENPNFGQSKTRHSMRRVRRWLNRS